MALSAGICKHGSNWKHQQIITESECSWRPWSLWSLLFAVLRRIEYLAPWLGHVLKAGSQVPLWTHYTGYIVRLILSFPPVVWTLACGSCIDHRRQIKYRPAFIYQLNFLCKKLPGWFILSPITNARFFLRYWGTDTLNKNVHFFCKLKMIQVDQNMPHSFIRDKSV